MKTHLRRSFFRRFAVTVLAVVLVLVVGLFLVLWYCSPGTMEKPLDSAGTLCTRGLAEKIAVPINGMQQGMIIRSCDTTHPVLLFLHGGPGMPEYFLERKYPTGLEALFTVCWWEQPGAGLSFDSDMPPGSLTVERLLRDATDVTEYLRRRFHTDRIYLMGHSNGTILGALLAARAPHLFHAYIGIAQVSRQMR
ncbi:MAG: alpha/beta fold hydrolase [Ignavibacteriae bacterium]|nr:alpha/beta fold hydrolase [Ignavibacteriota bacterium]